jgi:hypothetical protein
MILNRSSKGEGNRQKGHLVQDFAQRPNHKKEPSQGGRDGRLRD